jgi:hypothetical protein
LGFPGLDFHGTLRSIYQMNRLLLNGNTVLSVVVSFIRRKAFIAASNGSYLSQTAK